jgi:hypothetical protein
MQSPRPPHAHARAAQSAKRPCQWAKPSPAPRWPACVNKQNVKSGARAAGPNTRRRRRQNSVCSALCVPAAPPPRPPARKKQRRSSSCRRRMLRSSSQRVCVHAHPPSPTSTSMLACLKMKKKKRCLGFARACCARPRALLRARSHSHTNSTHTNGLAHKLTKRYQHFSADTPSSGGAKPVKASPRNRGKKLCAGDLRGDDDNGRMRENKKKQISKLSELCQ